MLSPIAIGATERAGGGQMWKKILAAKFGSRRATLIAILPVWCALPIWGLVYGQRGNWGVGRAGEHIFAVLLLSVFSLPAAFSGAILNLVGASEIEGRLANRCVLLAYWAVLLFLHIWLIRTRSIFVWCLIALIVVVSLSFNGAVLTRMFLTS
jgi:hypothetical protein